MANNKRAEAGDRSKRILVERRNGPMVEKIEGRASQIAKFDKYKNERKPARKGSRKAAPRSGVGKLLASGLYLLKGAAIVAKIGVDIANKIGGIAIVRFNFNFNFQQRRKRTEEKDKAKRKPDKDKAKRKPDEDKAKRKPDKDKAKRKPDEDKAKRKPDEDKAKRKPDKDKAKRK